MRLIQAITSFYWNLALPASLVAFTFAIVQLPLTETFPFYLMGMALVPVSLAVQFFKFELDRPEAYYFYYNLGLSKFSLYAFNFGLSSLIALFLMNL